MLNQYRENEILETALEAVKANLAMQFDYAIGPTVHIRLHDKDMHFCAEIKTRVVKPMIGQLLMLKDKLAHPLLLVTTYVTDHLADNLKQNDVEFIDTAGNVFIKKPPVYIFVKGNKPPETFRRIGHEQAFRATGLRLVLALLCDPDLINKPYREIAATAGIALGNIGWVINDLKNLGYLIDMGKIGYKLVQKHKLLDRWVTEYPERLRPKLLLGRFRGAEDWWKQKDLGNEQAQWGGEAAAAKLTGYLKPQNITIYAEQARLDDLLLKNRLKKDINGDVEILERFLAPAEEHAERNTVHPILVYADLMATADQRTIETARMIYEKYVLRYIGED
jgi:hypothetical protein